MKQTVYMAMVFSMFAALVFSGCGADDDDNGFFDQPSAAATVTGKAAAGAAAAGSTVRVYNTNGEMLGSSVTDSNGGFSVGVDSTDDIYVIVVTGTDQTMATAGPGSNEAVTPLTTVLLLSLLKIDYTTLAQGDMAASIANKSADITLDKVNLLVKQIRSLFGLSGMDITDGTELVIGGAGYDSLLDAIGVVFSDLESFLNNFTTTVTLTSTISLTELQNLANLADLTGTGVSLDPASAVNVPFWTVTDNEITVGAVTQGIDLPVDGTAPVTGSNPVFSAGTSPVITLTLDQQLPQTYSGSMTLSVADTTSSRTATVTMDVMVGGDGNNTWVTVPAQSDISASITYRDGTTATITFSNLSANGPVTSSGTSVTYDPSVLRDKIEDKLGNVSGVVNVEEPGIYTYTVTLNNIPVAYAAGISLTYVEFTNVTGTFEVQ